MTAAPYCSRLMADSPLLTVPQVAAEFQVTAQTIRNWIVQGVLPGGCCYGCWHAGLGRAGVALCPPRLRGTVRGSDKRGWELVLNARGGVGGRPNREAVPRRPS